MLHEVQDTNIEAISAIEDTTAKNPTKDPI